MKWIAQNGGYTFYDKEEEVTQETNIINCSACGQNHKELRAWPIDPGIRLTDFEGDVPSAVCICPLEGKPVFLYGDINDMHLIKSEGELEQKIDWKQVSTAASAPELFPDREDMWSSVFYKGAYVGQVQRQQDGTFHARIDTVPVPPDRYKIREVAGFETVHAAVEGLVFGRLYHEKDPRKQKE